jgi:SAM-dependent methyltransferase
VLQLTESVEADQLWMNASGDEWVRRNTEEIDHDESDRRRLGKPRREIDKQYLADVPRDAKILEVGSGYGRQLENMREMGFSRLVGMDINLTGLQQASAAGIQGDWSRLPFKDESFDLVCTTGTLMHVHPMKLRAVIDELVRVTRKWIYCFEQVSAMKAIGMFTSLHFTADLQIPHVWLSDLPTLISVLRSDLTLDKGHAWEGPCGKYVLLLYVKP